MCNLSVFAQAKDREVCGYFLDQEVLILCIIISGKNKQAYKQKPQQNIFFLLKEYQDLKTSKPKVGVGDPQRLAGSEISGRA